MLDRLPNRAGKMLQNRLVLRDQRSSVKSCGGNEQAVEWIARPFEIHGLQNDFGHRVLGLSQANRPDQHFDHFIGGSHDPTQFKEALQLESN